MKQEKPYQVVQDELLDRIRRSNTEELFTLIKGRSPAWQKSRIITRDYGVSRRQLTALKTKGVIGRNIIKGKAYWDELAVWLYVTRGMPKRVMEGSDYAGTRFYTYSRVTQLEGESREKAEVRLQAQVDKVRSWCSANGITVHQELSEISDPTGSELMKDLMVQISNGAVGCLVVDDVSRLGPSYHEAILKLCEFKNIPLRFVNSTFTTESRLEAREDLADLMLWYRSRGLI